MQCIVTVTQRTSAMKVKLHFVCAVLLEPMPFRPALRKQAADSFTQGPWHSTIVNLTENHNPIPSAATPTSLQEIARARQ
eukprot:5789590-Amphidinium_carterae.1